MKPSFVGLPVATALFVCTLGVWIRIERYPRGGGLPVIRSRPSDNPSAQMVASAFVGSAPAGGEIA